MVRRTSVALVLLVLGLVLLGTSGTYYGYTFFVSRNLNRLIVNIDLPNTPDDPSTLADLQQSDSGVNDQQILNGPSVSNQTLYPGSSIASRFWADLRGTQDLGQENLLPGFTSVTSLQTAGIDFTPAVRLSIPAVNITSAVEELAIRNLADSRQYETPKFTVGHIPITPNPGAAGNGWFFGHLESPIQKEGNVFARLPNIPNLLREGEDVYIIAETAKQWFLYKVTATNVVHQDEFALYTTTDARITLVSCYPQLKYDHRLLVTAMLVGVRKAPAM